MKKFNFILVILSFFIITCIAATNTADATKSKLSAAELDILASRMIKTKAFVQLQNAKIAARNEMVKIVMELKSKGQLQNFATLSPQNKKSMLANNAFRNLAQNLLDFSRQFQLGKRYDAATSKEIYKTAMVKFNLRVDNELLIECVNACYAASADAEAAADIQYVIDVSACDDQLNTDYTNCSGQPSICYSQAEQDWDSCKLSALSSQFNVYYNAASTAQSCADDCIIRFPDPIN